MKMKLIHDHILIIRGMAMNFDTITKKEDVLHFRREGVLVGTIPYRYIKHQLRMSHLFIGETHKLNSYYIEEVR